MVAREARRQKAAPSEISNIGTETEWSPPDFGGQRRTRIGASVVEQFVRGHNASDVLRELVQNEFDGGGDRLEVNFTQDSLEVIGNGKGVSREGWKRLSVIVGTGRVVGDGQGERVEAKANGIGSKNFGLRSLFLFGDEIFVRSGGNVCVLDLRTLETGKVKDPGYWGGRGVRIKVPFRNEAFEMLEPFTAQRESAAFDIMAGGMLATLVKLALPGERQGLREVRLHSARIGRTLEWKQKALTERSKMKGVSIVRRVGRLTDAYGGNLARRDFEELEFTTAIEVPPEFRSRMNPAYFKTRDGFVKIGISLPILRKRLDHSRPGHFHYPLQAPDARTGCLVAVSAPCELDNDRSNLTEHAWNIWLMGQAARFTVQLLAQDWIGRFGAATFHAVVPHETGSRSVYIDELTRLLREEECWPTRGSGTDRLAKASLTVAVGDALLDGFLGDNRYLDKTIAESEALRSLALAAGATRFTVGALVRLRCAGADASKLQTKLKPEEGTWHFDPYKDSLTAKERQILMAERLTALSKQLSQHNRADLRDTPSTLTATNELRPAKYLTLVSPEIWDVCPEPMVNRLHPDLVPHRAISGHCKPFDEQKWITEAAGRAAAGSITAAERAALYARITDEGTQLTRSAIQALRTSPVVKDHRGTWVSPEQLVLLKGNLGRFMMPVVHAPSKDLLRSKALVERLRIRAELNSDDLISYAAGIGDRPTTAEAFEKLLVDHMRLLTPSTCQKLRVLPFLRNRAGSLSAPNDLLLDNPLNRSVIGRDEAIIGGTNEALYRKLEIPEFASVATLLSVIEGHRNRQERPERPDLLYPAVVQSLRREKRVRDELKDEPIAWWKDSFHTPSDILIGPTIPKVFDGVLPVIRRLEEPSVAYLALGARAQPSDQDWEAFFRAVCEDWDRERLSQRTVRLLTDAYQLRGSDGLPSDLEDLECLVTRDGYLYSVSDIRQGLLAENDFHALADALDAADSRLGIVDVTERTRPFYHRLRLKPLSGMAGTGSPVFGTLARAPIWFKQHHDDDLVAMMRRPIFARALHAVAWRRRHMFDGYAPIHLDELAKRLGSIAGVAFYDEIVREYSVDQAVARIRIEAAIGDGVIGLVAPRTRLDFQQLVCQALAELAGAANAEMARTLSTDLLPLVLSRSTEEILVCLERMGINPRSWDRQDEPQLDSYDDALETAGEEAVRQMLNTIRTSSQQDAPPAFQSPPTSTQPQPAPAP